MPTASPNTEYVQQLRRETAAVRLMHGKFGVRRALSHQQIAVAAEAFHANGLYLSGRKKLINTRHAAYRACTKVISQARAYWREITVPYPEDGIRLIRKDLVDSFDATMTSFRSELGEATQALELAYPTLREEAQGELGELFNTHDYPTAIRDTFHLAWGYPSVEPPDYLKQLNPKLYEQEQERVAQRFEEAMRLAEQSFATELQQLVAHLVDRLSGDTDGKPKTLRDSAVENIREFFVRFKQMQIGSNADLDRLVEQAEQIVGGVDVQDLRAERGLRDQIAAQMSEVKAALESMVIEKPVRAIELEE
jgi:hypothetical protein